ncbi:MAG: alpha-glucan family phosphorylase [Candidatus Eisenbacteria bacterium]|nr:alpha-glucan family phosphorylase [Candidatus Eisenbacteria bacterium]
MRIHEFQVAPALPPRLAPLMEIAYNLRWCWDHDTIELFRRLSKRLWEEADHNPVRMLGEIDQAELARFAADEGFLVHMDRVAAELRRHMTRRGWFEKAHPDVTGASIAYFSAEFGLTECLQIYSGGLGILAGDHLKSCSELGVPLVGVGLLYQKGYFRQYLTNDGWQQERNPINDFHTLPILLERDPQGRPLLVQVEMAERSISAFVWRAQVGRVPLYLLDTNVPENAQADQDISDELYGGDAEMRIRQELLLGVGGMRALHALGHDPVACHMNEGHSAFLAIQRTHDLMQQHGIGFEEARTIAEAGNVFTTHTPVAAGIDIFPVPLVRRYLAPYAEKLGVPVERLIELGQQPGDTQVSMAVLAIHLANRVNGVSRLHARTARAMFSPLWPDVPHEEIPIGAIVNGVHARSWISYEMATLFDRYLGPRWVEEPSDQSIWESVSEIPDAELWRTHERRRERLVAYVRRTMRAQLERRGAPATEIETASEMLDPSALTIGFARRVVPYKRTLLLFHDFERLVRLLTASGRPVQLLFAGKAHPRDDLGKAIIRELIGRLRDPRIRLRAVFLEDYNMMLARYLVQGCDLWLNTPRRPREASGTSGMKVSANGAINLSVLDGWWDEAYAPGAGWAIGRGEEYTDEAYQDMVESRALYDLLENEIVPLFYTRGSDDIPRGWTARMKEAMRRLCPVFNSNRMVCEYVDAYYLPSTARALALQQNDCRRARELVRWCDRVRSAWDQVRILDVRMAGAEAGVEAGGVEAGAQTGAETGARTGAKTGAPDPSPGSTAVGALRLGKQAGIRVGDRVTVMARVALGNLQPSDVAVQIRHGALDEHGEIRDAELTVMRVAGSEGKTLLYQADLVCGKSGRRGFTVRALPYHEDLAHAHAMRLMHSEG